MRSNDTKATPTIFFQLIGIGKDYDGDCAQILRRKFLSSLLTKSKYNYFIKYNILYFNYKIKYLRF